MKQRIYQNQKKTKTFWCILREVTNVRPKPETIKKISIINLMRQDSFDILNFMNQYFLNVSDKFASISHDALDTTNPLQYLKYSSHQFNFSEVDVENLHKSVTEVKKKVVQLPF